MRLDSDFPQMRNHHCVYDLIFEIEIKAAVFDLRQHQARNIAGIHLAGVGRNGRRQIIRTDDSDPMPDNRFPNLGQIAITTRFRGHVYDY